MFREIIADSCETHKQTIAASCETHIQTIAASCETHKQTIVASYETHKKTIAASCETHKQTRYSATCSSPVYLTVTLYLRSQHLHSQGSLLRHEKSSSVKH